MQITNYFLWKLDLSDRVWCPTYYDEFNDHCYRKFPYEKQWATGLQLCKDDGADFVSLTSFPALEHVLGKRIFKT